VHNDSSTEPMTHEDAFASLAWLANGTLSQESASAVRAHLAHCAECRSEYEAQTRLVEAMREDGSGAVLFPAEASFQKLRGRIDADAPRSAGETNGPRLLSERAVRWLAAAVIVEAVGLGLAVWGLQSRTPAAYVTLSAPAPAYGSGALLRVVFEPGLRLADLQQLLSGIGAHVVDGPTPAGVFTLGFTGATVTEAQLEKRAAALRADPHVRFAEPLSIRAVTP
jgi:hypothetical protein